MCHMSKQFVIRLSTDSFIIVVYVLWKTKNATVLVFEITDWLGIAPFRCDPLAKIISKLGMAPF